MTSRRATRDFNPDGTVTNCVFLTAGCEINLAGLAPNFGVASRSTSYGDVSRGRGTSKAPSSCSTRFCRACRERSAGSGATSTI